MIDGLPPKGVYRAAELERRMLEEDAASKRNSLNGDEYSVLDFCHFLEAVKLGTVPAGHILPEEHVAFYRKIVERLIAAGELSPDAKERFDVAIMGNGREVGSERLSGKLTPNV